MTHKCILAIRHEWYALLGAIRFFTRIPVSDRIPHSEALLNHAARYFPAVGLLVGLVSALAFGLSLMALPKSVSILIAMAASIYLTGAFHEDGLTDMTDGLGGGWEKHRILEIMTDSRVGSYGVIAIALVLAMKFACLEAVPTAWIPVLLIIGHAFSRYCSVLIMAGMHYVREDALSKAKPLATQLSGRALTVATLFGLLPLLWLPFDAMVTGMVCALITTLWLGRKLQKWLGGYTGDCLGAVQQLSEVTFYMGVLTILR
jgi:adenosylcobinamide-GDP ribazoletransferase